MSVTCKRFVRSQRIRQFIKKQIYFTEKMRSINKLKDEKGFNY